MQWPQKFIFDKATEILNLYQVLNAAVTAMKPWAAYITMSYPPESDMILDLKLLEMVQQNDAEAIGLESIQKQINIFNTIDLDDKIRILMDTVCHYDVVQRDLDDEILIYSTCPQGSVCLRATI